VTFVGVSFRPVPAARSSNVSFMPTRGRSARLRNTNAAPLPTLPPDVMGRIARAALAAEETGRHERAWARLSSVCRTWRDSLRGVLVLLQIASLIGRSHVTMSLHSVPTHGVLHGTSVHCRTAHAGVPLHVWLTPAGLEAAGEAGTRFAIVNVRLDAEGQCPPPPETPWQIMSALAGSGATLAALHNFPLMEGQVPPQADLAAFTQLRYLSLLQIWDGLSVLHVAHLPATLERLELTAAAEETRLPLFSGLESLARLRMLMFFDYAEYRLGSAGVDGEHGRWRPMRVPPSFQVCISFPLSTAPSQLTQSPRNCVQPCRS